MIPLNEDEQLRLRCKSIQTSLNDALNGLMELLPSRWHITMIVHSDEAEWWLEDPDGNDVSSQWDGDSQDVYSFISHSMLSEKNFRSRR